MKILIIEDDELKYRHLVSFLKLNYQIVENENIQWEKSYKQGLISILENDYAFVLLDMSMHIFDREDEYAGGGFESYAGVMILDEVFEHNINAKIIVVTGYDMYGDGKTLEILKKELRESFPDFYLDTVYFVSNEDNWKNELSELIDTNNLWNSNS